MNGSKKTSALSHDQFINIVDHFIRNDDPRMAGVCLLLGRCIRVSDVLGTLRHKHIYRPDGAVRESTFFREQKTNKGKTVSLLGERLQEILAVLWYSLPRDNPDSHLFYNRNGTPLQDKGVKWHLAKFVGQWGIEQCSPHSFRKYGARYLFDNGYDIEVISQILNHSSVRETRTYLDIKPKEVEEALQLLNY